MGSVGEGLIRICKQKNNFHHEDSKGTNAP